MGFLTPKQPAVVEINGTQIQSAVQAIPVPIIWGSPRVPCNIIYANGFQAVKQKTGGKGILTNGKNTSNQFLYYATLICAIGEGPLQNIIAIWYDTNISFNLQNIFIVDPTSQVGKSGEPNTVPVNAIFFPGSPEQEPWTYIESNWPGDARTYKDTAYIGLPMMQLDSSGTPPQMNFMPRGLFANTCPLNISTLTGTYTNSHGEYSTSINVGYVDADPASVVYDFLTNARYGVGFPANLIDSSLFSNEPQCFNSQIGDSSFQTYCQAVGLGWSICLNNVESSSSILERWMKNAVTAIVWTGETLKFIPYYDGFDGTNPGWGADNPLGIQPKYFAPLVQPLMTLTDDILLQSNNPEDEPVTLSRVDEQDVYNYFRVTFKDRNNQFNDNVAMDSDEVSIELFGNRADKATQGDEYALMDYAQASATMQLQRGMSIRRHVTFRLPPEFGFFDPMDIVNITSGPLSGFGIRIITIEEDDSGAITVEGEEFTAGNGQPTIFSGPPTTPPFIMQTNSPAGNVQPPIIFEPTQQALQAEGLSQPTIVMGTCGDLSTGGLDPNWGGCTVYVSLDDITYVTLADIFGAVQLAGPSTMGVLTATLPAYGGSEPDNTNTLEVDLTESAGELSSTTTPLAAIGATLCVIVDADGCYELLAYTTATLTGPFKFSLTGLYRGLYGTQLLEHISTANFMFLNSAVFQAPLPPQYTGQTVYVKMTSFNIWNQGEQDLSTVATYTYVPIGAGTNFAGNAILQALEAGTPVNMETATGSLSCNDGGSAACAPVLFSVDLEQT